MSLKKYVFSLSLFGFLLSAVLLSYINERPRPSGISYSNVIQSKVVNISKVHNNVSHTGKQYYNESNEAYRKKANRSNNAGSSYCI